jgi:hypothetical protein
MCTSIRGSGGGRTGNCCGPRGDGFGLLARGLSGSCRSVRGGDGAGATPSDAGCARRTVAGSSGGVAGLAARSRRARMDSSSSTRRPGRRLGERRTAVASPADRSGVSSWTVRGPSLSCRCASAAASWGLAVEPGAMLSRSDCAHAGSGSAAVLAVPTPRSSGRNRGPDHGLTGASAALPAARAASPSRNPVTRSPRPAARTRRANRGTRAGAAHPARGCRVRSSGSEGRSRAPLAAAAPRSR